MYYAESAEIAVLGAERPVDDAHLLHQLGSDALQRAKVALAVTLGGLVLRDVVHQDLESAADAAMVEIETESPDLDRFPAALVLACVDAGIQDVKDLVVPGEQRFENTSDCFVSTVGSSDGVAVTVMLV